jgi:hypothetical protein
MPRLPRRPSLAATAIAGATAFAAVLAPAAPAAAADQLQREIVASGWHMADVMWASQSPFAGVFLWPDNTSASQEFDLLDSGNGWFRIRARHSGQCLMPDWRGGTYANGTRIIQYTYCAAGYTGSEWQVRYVYAANSPSATKTVLVNHGSGKCLDADNPAGGQPPAQAVLQLWDCISSPFALNVYNQAWTIYDPNYVPVLP